MDKRGGSHKNWKNRYFMLSENGLSYYKSQPNSAKQMEGSLGECFSAEIRC